MSARTRGLSLGASAKLALARVRRRPGRTLGPLVGIALVVAFAAAVAAEGTIAGEQASRATLRGLSPLDRTVRVTWQGPATPSVDHRARHLLSRLGLGSASEVTLLHPVRLNGIVVRPAAISPLRPWIGPGSTPPGACRTADCPMLLSGGSRATDSAIAGRALTSAGIRLTAAGRVALTSAAPLGFVPEPNGHTGPPVLLTGDSRGLESVKGFSGIFRTHTWLASLPVSSLHAWQLARFERRLQQAQQALLATTGGFTLTAPFGGLDAARSQARAAPRRLLLAGGGALAALILFVVLVVGGLRPDTDAELTRLETAGASATQRAAFVSIEAGVMCGAALLVGAALAVAATAVLAATASEPAGAILTHTIVTPVGALALVAAWLAATAFIAALLLIPPGPGVANTAAVAALGALLAGLAETSGAPGDTLSVLLAPLCCAAAGVIVFRVAGTVLRGGERVARNGPLSIRLALVGLARSPSLPSLAIAFLAVAVGLGGFALCYRATLLRGTSDEAANAVPLDALVAAGPDFRTPLELASATRWSAISGGAAWPVLRTDAGFVRGSGTVTVPALGIPARSLPDVRGWRASDGSASLSVLARRLAPAAPGVPAAPGGHAGGRGPALSPAARSLAVRARAGAASAVVVADLQNRQGAITRVTLGEAGGLGGPARTLTARLPALHGGPWYLAALELSTPTGLEATNGHQNAENPAGTTSTTGSITFGPVRALDASGRTVTTAPLGDWRAVGAASGSGHSTAGAPLHVRFSDTGTVGVVRPVQPSDIRPIPVLTDPATAAAAGPGGSLALTVDSEPVNARVVGTLRRFPTVDAGSAGFIIADQRVLEAAVDAQLPGRGAANEIWIATPHPDRLRAALRTGPLSELSATYRDTVEHGLRTAPIARAVLGTMIAAAAMSALLAIVGLLFVTLGPARSRAAERDLAAQGLGPSGLRRELRVRVGVAGTSGVLAGLVISLLLARLAVTAVRAAGTIATPQPPLITVTPAVQLVVWTVAGIAVLAATAYLATFAAGRRA